MLVVDQAAGGWRSRMSAGPSSCGPWAVRHAAEHGGDEPRDVSRKVWAALTAWQVKVRGQHGCADRRSCLLTPLGVLSPPDAARMSRGGIRLTVPEPSAARDHQVSAGERGGEVAYLRRLDFGGVCNPTL